MRILFAWELGSGPESLFYMKLVAAELRARYGFVEITLATSLNAKDIDVSWADNGYSTPKFTFRHDAVGEGVVQQLHYLGWTTQELREIQFNNWRTLLDKARPNLVVCCDAPGALVTAALMGHECLVLSHEREVDVQASLALFPELDDWAHGLVDVGISAVCNRPGVTFISSIVDGPRTSMTLNASAFEHLCARSGADEPLILGDASNEQWQAVGARLRGLGYEPQVMSPQVLYQDQIQQQLAQRTPSFVLGSYDRHSTALALSLGVPYLGIPRTTAEKVFARQLDATKRSFTVGSDLLMLNVFHGQRAHFTQDALSKTEKDRGGFCKLEDALGVML